jgi:hypothetical protein
MRSATRLLPAIVFMIGCGGSAERTYSGGDFPAGDVSASSESAGGTYTGTAQLQLGYADVAGNIVDSRTFTYPAVVRVKPPARSGQFVEDNPFSLYVGPADDRQMRQNGVITLWSAMPMRDPRDGVEFMLQYWSLTADGDDIRGRLVDTHIGQGAALNLLNDMDELVPGRPELGIMPRIAALEAGCTIQGSISSDEVDIVVKGNVTDKSRPFALSVTAAR